MIKENDRFGKWTVVSFSGMNNNHMAYWLCVCDCGRTASVRAADLTRGKTSSCRECRVASCTKHGQARKRKTTKAYRRWASMWHRCTNPRSRKFKDYGARGIKVCERWRDFANFYADMGDAPGVGVSIDRINNDGDYCPENCRWATAKVQRANRRDCSASHGR